MRAPSRKWIVAQVVTLAAIATMWVESNEFNDPETIALIGWFVQAVSSYLIPNTADNIVDQAAGRSDVDAIKTARAR
jgi:hypothetical protein